MRCDTLFPGIKSELTRMFGAGFFMKRCLWHEGVDFEKYAEHNEPFPALAIGLQQRILLGNVYLYKNSKEI